MSPTLVNTLIDYGVRAVGVIALLIVAFRVARWVGGQVTKGVETRVVDRTLARFTGNIARYLVLIGAVLACLSIFGIRTTSFAAILGASALAVGLAFQGTLSNFSAGVLLLVFRPFGVDDTIKAAGQTGKVRELGLFVTTLVTPDNRVIFVPNAKVASDVVENLTREPTRRVDVAIGCSYGATIEATRGALTKAAEAVDKRDPEKGFQVVVTDLGDTTVNWQVRVWCATADTGAVSQAAIEQIKLHLEAAGIGIRSHAVVVPVAG